MSLGALITVPSPDTSCPHHGGQHYHCLLHQQAGGLEVSHALCRGDLPLGLVDHREDPVVSGVPSQNSNSHIITDFLCRKFVTDHERELHGTTVTFQANSKCTEYYSRGGLGVLSQGNALVLYWLDQFNYTFPPVLLLPQFLQKFRQA